MTRSDGVWYFGGLDKKAEGRGHAEARRARWRGLEVICFRSLWSYRRYRILPAFRGVLSHSRLALVRSVYSSVASCHHCSSDGVTRGGEDWRLAIFAIRGAGSLRDPAYRQWSFIAHPTQSPPETGLACQSVSLQVRLSGRSQFGTLNILWHG